MSFIPRIVSLIILGFLSFGVSSCSVYKSTGRKSFESKAPQSNVTASSVSLASLDSTCWNQPIDEPLWNLAEATNLSVTKINEDEIQVCAQPL